jgi:hypothetical protein
VHSEHTGTISDDYFETVETMGKPQITLKGFLSKFIAECEEM